VLGRRDRLDVGGVHRGIGYTVDKNMIR
jgi:hypothetical protein